MTVRVGVDAVDVPRVRGILDRRGRSFLARTMTAGEREYFERRRDPAPRVAGTLAAKEALFKVLGVAPRWQQVEVRRLPSGRPEVLLSGSLRGRAETLGITGVDVSISHTGALAVAVAAGTSRLDKPPDGDTT